MIGSLMYLTSSRPDIMFDVCVCARFQVNPKVSHLYDVKRIFRYLKGQPKLGLWCRLVSWQCKKQTVVANSITKAEYVAALNSNEKQLIQMIKIHIDKNVADLLTKVFDKGIRVNAGDSKLMLLGINLLLLEKVNAARHNLLLMVFWSTVKAKMVNREVQLQALVDGKKIVVTEASVRRDLQLEDVDGVDCLPNATIFE
ncbi:hypothetical protein Tco_1084061 [Tanacetum coccineum]